MQSLKDLMRHHHVDVPVTFDSIIQRNGAQWFVGKEAKIGEKTVLRATFGDFSQDGLKVHWKDDVELNQEEEKEFNEYFEMVFRKEREERLTKWESERAHVEKEWATFNDRGSCAYATRKKFDGLYGCRIEESNYGPRLIVPARDVNGALWGYQRIYNEKLPTLGTDKLFRKDSRKEGCFHSLSDQSLEQHSTLFLCEGISTAVAIYESTGKNIPVLSCFDAGNLLPVAKALREKYPEKEIVFCADNDCYPSKDGKIYHTGKVKAEKAAEAVGNSRVILPHFPKEEGTL